ncbi:MAG: peptidylprolyl isomerase, partial [Planctomycetota bacterium]
IAARAGVSIPTGVSPSFFPLANVTLQSGSPLWLSLDGYDPNDDPLSFSATSDNPSLVLPSIPSGNSSLRIKVQNFGDMTFELFDNLVPDLTAHIKELAQAGVFNTTATSSEVFGAVVKSPDLTVIGSSLPSAAVGGTLSPVDDQFHPDLQNNQAGLLGLSKWDDDSGNAQFYILGAPARQLDFQQPIFGMLTEGESNRHNINDTTTVNNVPTRTVTINSVEVFQDSENGLLMLKAPPGASGQANVTVRVDDGHGHTFSQTFHVTVIPSVLP